MERGEVWWAQLPLPAGRRPVVLVSRDEAYSVRTQVTVAPVTTTIRHIPSEVSLSRKHGMPRDCVINCDNLTTIPKAWLQQHITTLAPAKLNALGQAIRFAIAL